MACVHFGVEPVESLAGELVAWLCPRCDVQVPHLEASTIWRNRLVDDWRSVTASPVLKGKIRDQLLWLEDAEDRNPSLRQW